jgi:hypothetical protein
MPIGVAGDHQAEANPLGLRGKRGQHGPSLVAGAFDAADDGIEMVEEPTMREDRVGVGFFPDRDDGLIGGVLLRGLDSPAEIRHRADPFDDW